MLRGEQAATSTSSALLFSCYEYSVAVGWADVLSRVRGCNDAGESCTRLVVEIAGRAIWIMNTQRAIVEGRGHKVSRSPRKTQT
jgi:hypothetical protein